MVNLKVTDAEAEFLMSLVAGMRGEGALRKLSSSIFYNLESLKVRPTLSHPAIFKTLAEPLYLRGRSRPTEAKFEL